MSYARPRAKTTVPHAFAYVPGYWVAACDGESGLTVSFYATFVEARTQYVSERRAARDCEYGDHYVDWGRIPRMWV
jgi:hypothetical protein